MTTNRGMSGARITPAVLHRLGIPVTRCSGPGLAAVVYLGFVLIHVFLAQGIPMPVDIDEMQYGDAAVAILDGFWKDLDWRRLRGREGFPLLFGPLVTPFFAAFGASMLALRIAFICFSGIWAAAWVSVARLAAPQAPVWAVAGLFLLPAPFVSRYAISPMAMSTHLGVSAAHGLVWLLLLVASGSRGVSRWFAVLAAGLVGGYAVYGGFLFLVLLPGAIVAAALLVGKRGLVVFATGLAPGLSAALPLSDMFSLWWMNRGLDGIPLPPYLWDAADVGRPLAVLRYLPGYPPPREWAGNYLPVGFAYFGLVGLAHILGQRVRDERHAPIVSSLAVTIFSLLLACVWIRFTPFDLDPAMWDAPRYAVPLLPIAAIVVLRACSLQAAAGRRLASACAALLLVAHVVGIGTHVSWHDPVAWHGTEGWIRGHSTGSELLAFPLDALPASPRRGAYAQLQGATACAAAAAAEGFPLLEYPLAMKPMRRVTLDVPLGEATRGSRLERWVPASIDATTPEEFWRGVGRCVFVARALGVVDPPRPVNPPAEVDDAIWHGIGIQAHECDFGMEAAQCPPAGVTRNLPATAAERAAYIEGWSRACVHPDHGPALLPPVDIDRRGGRRMRWELDLALPTAPAIDDATLEQLRFVRWRP